MDDRAFRIIFICAGMNLDLFVWPGFLASLLTWTGISVALGHAAGQPLGEEDLTNTIRDYSIVCFALVVHSAALHYGAGYEACLGWPATLPYAASVFAMACALREIVRRGGGKKGPGAPEEK